MTIQEFSNEFDILYNNIMSNQAPGLNEYEKSVFLTKAQDEIVKAYFNPKGNKFQEGYDDSPKRQIDFSMLVETTNPNKYSGDTTHMYNPPDPDGKGQSVFYEFPSGIMMILNETFHVRRGNLEQPLWLTVIPISYIECIRLTSKPYKYPIKNQAWRLISQLDNSGTTVLAELILGPNDKPYLDEDNGDYIIRYIRKPKPIILEELPTGLSIDGGNKGPSECELDSEIHHEILQRAVELAKAAYTGDLSSQIALGQQSETNMGIVATQSK